MSSGDYLDDVLRISSNPSSVREALEYREDKKFSSGLQFAAKINDYSSLLPRDIFGNSKLSSAKKRRF